jgi:pyrroline-5-carboxylate reductase
MKVLVLGAGKMVSALLMGFKNAGQDLSGWTIFSPSGSSAKNLANSVGANSVDDLKEVAEFEWILIGCKPQQLHSLKKLIGNDFSEHLFVSLLAAISEKDQMRVLGIKSLVRVMPNLPVEHNSGIVLISSHSVNSQVLKFENLFSLLGEVIVVNDEDLDELTLLTGSGPALFYEFALGLSHSFSALDVTKREYLASMVLRGAGISVSRDQSLHDLIDSVTSKGGVTRAVLDNWKEGEFQEVIRNGIEAGKLRSRVIKDSLRN